MLVTQLALTISVVSLAVFVTRRQIRRSFDAALHGRAMSVASLVTLPEDPAGPLVFSSSQVPPPLDREHPDLFQVLGPKGSVLGQSKDWPGSMAPPDDRQRNYWTAELASGEYRVVRLDNIEVLDREDTWKGPQPTITIFYAASTDEMNERLWVVAAVTGFGSLGLLALATAVTIWAIRRGLSPLAQLAGSASRVTPEDWRLDERSIARDTEELVPLTEAMDGMLRSLQQAFEAQREFVANAAHELKTPIAVLKSTLQLSLQKPRQADEYRAQLKTALEDVERLETLTHSMLRLARAERMQKTDRSSLPLLDLVASCEQSADRLHPVAEQRNVHIEVKAQGSPQFRADSDDMELVWSNLLENAIRYSASGSAVTLSVASENGHARVEVIDRGCGIEPAELPMVFQRFYRADDSRSRDTGGYGLGLAIVKAMVEAYGGSIQAESHPGEGTKMTVLLPIQP